MRAEELAVGRHIYLNQNNLSSSMTLVNTLIESDCMQIQFYGRWWDYADGMMMVSQSFNIN